MKKFSLPNNNWAILVVGVAGVGKTVFGRKLAEKLAANFIDLPAFILERKLYESYDVEAGDYIIDLRRISLTLGSLIKNKRSVISSIYVFKPRSVIVPLILVIRIRPDILVERLKERCYPESKIAENVAAEIIDKPLHDAVVKYGEDKVVQIDLSNRDVDELASRIALEIVSGDPRRMNMKIDWISELEKISKLSEILEFISKTQK
ncbi:MAG: AAA family ATPase [Nitrososphaerota archaeon]